MNNFWSGKDALNRPITLLQKPIRIISLVPSQTELLVDLGINERLIGRTRYCIHPQEKLSQVPEVGGTKGVDLNKIEALKPDLILAGKEENPQEVVNALAKLAPVYVTDVQSIPTAISMCKDVGKILGLTNEAATLASKIESSMKNTKNIALNPQRILYLIWRKPWMAAGPTTFIHSCLEHIGFQNAAQTPRYPELDEESIINLRPDRVFLSSEPYPFKENHKQELQTLLPKATIEFIDGELFSWYGSRMLKMPSYWRSLIAPT